MESRHAEGWHRWVALGLRVLLLGVFLLSGVAKLLAIDDFELYVFSYGWMPLGVAYVVARLCIAMELGLGLWIAVGWWPKVARLTAVWVLVGFSLFLCYALLVGRNESCQCFGRLVDFSPAQSLLKNAVLVVLVLVYYRLQGMNEWHLEKRWKRWVAVSTCGAVLVGVFCISVPDNWMYVSGEAVKGDSGLSEQFAEQGSLSALGAWEGNRVVAFVTPGCPYCRLARQKLGSIAERNELPAEAIVYVEPKADGEELERRADGTWLLPASQFMHLTHGRRPYIVLVENGQATLTFHYRNISEQRIVHCLKGQ
ncbi:MAG: DoxX family membrane protein [Bacteroidales bacterium]|nr:DoxX family membrane protein [Bacteroidales bacterium]